MISTAPVSAFHCLLFAIALGSSLAEYDAEALGTGNARSNTILSCFLIAVFCMVGIIFLWTLRKEIHGFFVKVCQKLRARALTVGPSNLSSGHGHDIHY
jgi:hypothetical protein